MHVDIPATLRWLESSGGPFVVVAENAKARWHGAYRFTADANAAEVRLPDGGGLIAVPDGVHSDTDYARACAVKKLCDAMVSDAGHVLVLGDEPAMTTWLPASDAPGGSFVRWIFADGDDAVKMHLRDIPVDGWQPCCELVVESSPLRLFEAAQAGALVNDGESLPVALSTGRYDVSSLELRPDVETHLRLHRLVPRSG